jgi:hypothetical protein
VFTKRENFENKRGQLPDNSRAMRFAFCRCQPHKMEALPSWARIPLHRSTLPHATRSQLSTTTSAIVVAPPSSRSGSSGSPSLARSSGGARDAPTPKILSPEDVAFVQEQYKSTLASMHKEIESLKAENKGGPRCQFGLSLCPRMISVGSSPASLCGLCCANDLRQHVPQRMHSSAHLRQI